MISSPKKNPPLEFLRKINRRALPKHYKSTLHRSTRKKKIFLKHFFSFSSFFQYQQLLITNFKEYVLIF
ncbi:MAG: hypothetical protein M5E90_05240, partial [Asgard group archaeon]|nr:hypothetical protein [Asgard group archaeon]